MFNKKHTPSTDYELKYENVAIPEVHTHKHSSNDKGEASSSDNEIDYENVAIPEIHIRKDNS